MRHRTFRLRGIAVGVAALLAWAGLVVVTPATATPSHSALTGRTVERTGNCRGGRATWDLDVQAYPRRRLRIEFEIDEIPRGQRWSVFVANRGRRVLSATRRATVSGDIELARFTRNRRGRDRVRAAAVNPRTGSTCRAAVRF
jgi:hypothetical protein